ncbi:MAG: hypothetical protein ACYC6L_15290 [Anaerolineae bacterium]
MDKNNNQPTSEQGFEEQSLREVMEIERSAEKIIRNAELEAKHIIEAAKTQAEAMQAEEIAKWRQANDAKMVEFHREVDGQVQAIRNEEQARILAWLEKAKKNEKQALSFSLRTVLLVETKE